MVEVPASRLRLAAAVLRHLAGTKTTHAAIAAREHAAEFDRLTASPAARGSEDG